MQPDALALQLLKAVGLEDVDAGEDGLGGAGGGDEGKGGQDEDGRGCGEKMVCSG